MNKKLKKIYFKFVGPIMRMRFKYKDFTIISNNCFGGIIYRNHHMEYLTPTAGLFFMPDDFIKFIYNIKHYLSVTPIQVLPKDSRYCKYLKEINYSGSIGKLDDVEVMFLHYPDFNEAKSKWLKRASRVNYDRIIYKFNDQNNCTYKNLVDFQKFNAKNKICFTAKKYDGIDSYVLSQFEKDGFVVDDTKEKNTKKVFNIYKYINNMK